MRTYTGRRLVAGGALVMFTEDGKAAKLDIAPSQGVYNHSTEFEWGYGGSGPAQLSLALLLDAIGHTPIEGRPSPETAPVLAERWYQAFKNDYVSQLGDTWKIDQNEIMHWLRMASAQAQTKRKDYSIEMKFHGPQSGSNGIIHG